MAVVRIRIVAQNDPSLKNALLSYAATCEKVDKQTARSSQRAAAERRKGTESVYRFSARAEQEFTAIVTREEAKRTREHERAVKHVARVRDRHFADTQRQEERAEATTIRTSRRTAEKVVSAVRGVGRQALGFVTGAAEGMGIDLGIASNMKKNVDVDRATRKIANVTAQSQNRAVTEADNARVGGLIRSTGDSAKIEYGEVAAGLDEFVKVSSDLGTAEKTFKSIGDIAQATGSDFVLLAKMAGEFNAKLDDGPDKAKQLMELVTGFAGLSARGAIEIEDMATFANVLAGAGGKIEGGQVQAMMQMGALAQISRDENKGTPAEANRSAAALMRDVTKKANLERLQDAGIDVFGDKSRTTLKSPEQILTNILKSTGGDIAKLTKLLPNEMSRAAVEALSKTYLKEGEGGIHKRFSGLMEGLTPEALKSSAENMKRGAASDVAALNNRLMESFARLIPVVESLMPAIAKGAEFLSNHLGLAISAAVVASIGKEAIGAAISKAITGAAPGAPGAPGAPMPPASVGGAMTLIATGAVAFTATTVFLEAMEKQDEKSSNRIASDEMDLFQTMDRVKKGERGGIMQLLSEQIQIGKNNVELYGKGFLKLDNPEEYMANLNEAKRVLQAARDDSMRVATQEAMYRPAAQQFDRPGQDWTGAPTEYRPEAGTNEYAMKEHFAALKTSGEAGNAILQSILGAISGGITVNNMPTSLVPGTTRD